MTHTDDELRKSTGRTEYLVLWNHDGRTLRIVAWFLIVTDGLNYLVKVIGT